MAESRITFERIHPFSDGNGRTGRMILLYQSLLDFGITIMTNNNNRGLYVQALANQDNGTLSTMFQDLITYEKERIENFSLRTMIQHSLTNDLAHLVNL